MSVCFDVHSNSLEMIICQYCLMICQYWKISHASNVHTMIGLWSWHKVTSCYLLSPYRKKSRFSFTRQSSVLLERVAVCVYNSEPVLLVGETGTGKTSSVQYLAEQMGKLGETVCVLWIDLHRFCPRLLYQRYVKLYPKAAILGWKTWYFIAKLPFTSVSIDSRFRLTFTRHKRQLKGTDNPLWQQHIKSSHSYQYVFYMIVILHMKYTFKYMYIFGTIYAVMICHKPTRQTKKHLHFKWRRSQ